MWIKSNTIPIENLKGKDFLLFKFACGLCQGENEIVCFDFDINFLIQNNDLQFKCNLMCPNCESNYHDLELKLTSTSLIIQIESEGFIDEPTTVNQNSICYSLHRSDLTDFHIEWILELEFLKDILGIDPFKEFNTSIEDIKLLINAEKSNTNTLVRKLIFSNVITVLETYIGLTP